MRVKIVLPIAILILIFLIITTALTSSQYTKSKSLKELENGIILATHISKILHEIQKERGLTSGFVINNSKKFKEALLNHREVVNKKSKELYKFLIIIESAYIKSALREALEALEKISDIRKEVDALSVTAKKAMEFYSNMNDKFLHVIIEISKISKIPKITKNIIAYSHFLYAKENAGIERAVGTAILSQEKFSDDIRTEFIYIIATQRLYMKNFLRYASHDGKVFYNKNLQGKSIDEVKKTREAILNTSAIKEVKSNPKNWFMTMTLKIDKLKLIDDFLEKEIIFNIKKELSSTYKFLGIFIVLNIISIIIFLSMIILTMKHIKSQKKFKNLTDKYIISSVTDPKGKIISASDAFSRISGYSKQELIGKAHSIIRHPDMPKDTYKEMWKTLKGGNPWRGRLKNLKKNGECYWVYANIEPFFNKKGNIEAYAAIRLDITENEEFQKKIEEKERLYLEKELEQKEYLNTVIESNNHAIIAIDKTKTILTYNIKAQEIFGFTQEEMIGSKNLLHIIPLKYKNLHTVASSLYFKTGQSKGLLGTTLEMEGLKKDGKIIPIRISFGVSDSQDKKIVVASILDITQEREQERILKQQSKLAQMGEMISMIAHQWRQPLNAISAVSVTMNVKAKRNNLDKETTIELANKIAAYSQYLSTTIDDFRNFFKSNKEKQHTTYSEVIRSVLFIIENSLIYKNIKLIQELHCEEEFSTYANELKQVILNLIKNAEDVLLEREIDDPYIKIDTYKEGDSLVLQVSDNGGGVPDSIIDQIFDPYFSTKLKKDGTGLGLYMSKTIIEDHCAGKLTVSNSKEGAVFKIILERNSE